MKKQILFTYLLIILFCLNLFAQKEGNIWYFADSCGIDFNNSPPTLLTDGISTTFNTAASISDKYGNFLFNNDVSNKLDLSYNAMHCRLINKNFETLKNSDSLRLDVASFQGTLILPKPESDKIYYIFQHATSVYYVGPTEPYIGHLYSIVDMNLDSGLGEMTSKNKLLIEERLCEKMIAIKHGNGRDWWILLHGYGNLFYKVLFTPNGIDTIFEQNIGPNYSYSPVSFFTERGDMAASFDGTKIALADNFNKLDLFCFDRCNGEISHWVQLAPQNGSSDSMFYQGVAFSSNGRLLYATARTENCNFIFQYDLHSQNNIIRQTIWQEQTGLDFNSTIRLTPQKKIYINHAYSSFLHIIHNPDSIGSACNFEENAIFLNGAKSTQGLPNIPNFNLGPLLGSPCDTLSIVQPEDPPEELSTGINDLGNGDWEFRVYPNPASTTLIVEINTYEFNDAVFKLYNMLGQIVFEKAIEGNSESITIDIDKFIAGFYSYSVSINNEVISSERIIFIK